MVIASEISHDCLSASTRQMGGMTLPIGDDSPTSRLSRRGFLVHAGAALVPALYMPPALASNDFWSRPRELWIQRKTGRGLEEFKGAYFADGRLLLDPYIAVCKILRDVQASVAVQMSPVLLDILCGIQGVARAYGHVGPMVTTSGYRTVETNQRTEGAAKGSLHREGRAWDGRMPGYSASMLAEAAKYLRGGGVGLYLGRGFCHVDDGRLRAWRGA